MTAGLRNPWLVQPVAEDVIARLARSHEADRRAAELDVDIMGDPHREDDNGRSWALLSQARRVDDVLPGRLILIGSAVGTYFGHVVDWDFAVDDEDPVVTFDLVAAPPNEVRHLLDRLGRRRSEAPATAPLAASDGRAELNPLDAALRQAGSAWVDSFLVTAELVGVGVRSPHAAAPTEGSLTFDGVAKTMVGPSVQSSGC